MTGIDFSRRSWFGRLTFCLVGLVATGAASRATAQPTVAELLSKCPTLTSTDESIKTFEFTGTLPFGEARFEYAWSRGEGYFLMFSDRKTGVPIVVATDDHLLQFVAADGAVELNVDHCLSLDLRTKADALQFGLGKTIMPADKVVTVNVDPASFVAQIEADQWRRDEAPSLRYSAPSPSGKSRLTVDFDPAQPYPLKRLEIKSVNDPDAMLLIDDLRVNQPLRRKLKPFPKDAEFPPSLLLARVATIARTEAESEAALMLKIAMRTGVASGIDDPTVRPKYEKFEKIDWESAAANRAKFGPALIKLFGREASAVENPSPGGS